MKKLLLPILFLTVFSLATVHSAYAYITVSGTGTGGSAVASYIQTQLAKYQDQTDLANGMANASAFSANAVTFRGYSGYYTIAVTVGAMAGLQTGGASLDYFQNFGQELRDNGDAEMGVAINAPTVQVMWHATEDFYIGLKFGYIDYNYESWTFNVLCVGIPVSYQLVGTVRFPTAIFLWRGITINSGLFYQSNTIEYLFKPGRMDSGGYYVNPAFTISADTTSWVIPFEVITAIRVLWIVNITAGVGIDFMIGKSKISYDGNPEVTDVSGVYQGSLTITGEQSGGTQKYYMPKLVAGIGFVIWPVVIDVPVSWYYLDNGFSVGLTAGIAF